jgi:hypothetical protein
VAISLSSSGGASGSTNSLAITGVTAAAGTILGVTALGVVGSNTATAVSGVTDNAAGGSNPYALPPGAASGSFFASQSQFSCIATLWTQVVRPLSASTITITWSGGPPFFTLGQYGVWAGIGTGAITVAAANTQFLTSPSSAATPTVSAGNNNLVIATANLNGAISSASASYTVLTAENFAAWLGTTAAGATSSTLTFTAASPLWSTSLVAIGQPPARPVVRSAAVSRASNW